MKLYKLSEMIGGWFVGNFSPTTFTTPHCEVSFKEHKKDEFIAPHYHKIATEINVLLTGKMTMHGQEFTSGDVIVMEPNDIADPTFSEDSTLIVVKIPSAKDDKYFT